MGVQKAYENKKIAYTQEMLCLHLSPNKPKNQNKRVKRWIIESSLEVLASSSFCKENTKHQTPTKIPSSLSFLSLSLSLFFPPLVSIRTIGTILAPLAQIKLYF
jgi:hypothetical protein